MEAYKSSCPDCGAVYFWTGYKTGIGKTPEQLAAMKRQETVCRECGSGNLKTGLDYESEEGRALDDVYGFAAEMIKDMVKGNHGGSPVGRGAGPENQ